MRALEDLDAGAFTVVMATGIVGVGARLEGIAPLADALLALACVSWLVLAAILRERSVRSFALVAGTAVVGVDFLLLGQGELALALWSLAAALWLAVAAAIRLEAADALLTVVATESLAVLGATLDRHHLAPLGEAAIGIWALGLALYPLVAGRTIRSASRERNFNPTLWIVMGALAIATLAASEILLDRRALDSDVALATWAAASSVIPFLVAAELRVRSWRYEVARWSFVFPLGMYGVASHMLGAADGLASLRDLGTVFFAVALAAWTATAVGLARRYMPIAWNPEST
ncbi:MAG: tellurite resistance/C4-dicarboxylate transporter family protein [Gaiellaceae bacterium]